MPARPVLLLGGTRDAREIARRLHERGHDVVTSLAGVTADPQIPPGRLRVGGFGGIEGLAHYLRNEGIALVIDATHPFAAQMSRHAHAACAGLRVPLLRLDRPAWSAGDGDRWIDAVSPAAAASLLPPGARVLLTIGRKEVAPFLARPDLTGWARMIEAPPHAPPPGWVILRERPPFTRDAELALLRGHAISHVVCKNSGGALGTEKLQAARLLGLPVVMIARPAKPPALSAAGPEALAEAAEGLLSP